MRWIRYISAVIAILFLALWLFSYFYVAGVYVPIVSKSGCSFSIYANYTSLGISHGDEPHKRGDQWGFDIESRSEIEDRLDIIRDWNKDLDYMIDVPEPEELLTYGYDTFSFSDPRGQWSYHGSIFTIPTWLPTLIFGLWPAIALTLHIKRRYFTHGVCRKCGYDLRGTPSGVCPECGWRPKRPVSVDT